LLLSWSLLLLKHKLNLIFTLENNALIAIDSLIVFSCLLYFVCLFAGFLPTSYAAEQYPALASVRFEIPNGKIWPGPGLKNSNPVQP